MSATIQTPTPDSAAAIWGAPAVSIYSLTVFLVALVIAYFAKNDTALTLLLGAASANATAVIQFWVGSSSSSQKKDANAAAQTAQMTAAVTAAVPVAPGTGPGSTTTTTTSTTAAPPAAV